jgi:osmotically-inducible protein OsmY
MSKRLPLALATGLLAVATAALARDGGASDSGSYTGSYTDDTIARNVQHDLEGLGLGDVHVEVIAGEVTLRGVAPSLGAARKAVDRAYKVNDVQAVDNEMTVDTTSDGEIRAGLEDKLERYAHYTIYDHVVSSVHDGTVELSGEVTMPYKVNEIESTLADVAGIQKIENHIRVLPDDPSDESLRTAVAIAIYRDFPEYAMRPVRPIHVIVEKGRVTLYGTVGDAAEERIVEREARQAPGAVGVDDRLQLAS